MNNCYLLDTHCLIWFQENNNRIPNQIMNEIQNGNNVVLFSQISLFEISIKQKVGKLPNFNADVEEIYEQAIKDNFTYLSIQNEHIFKYNNIPLLENHRDPFDRLLLATALVEDATILSADEKLHQYQNLIKVKW